MPRRREEGGNILITLCCIRPFPPSTTKSRKKNVLQRLSNLLPLRRGVDYTPVGAPPSMFWSRSPFALDNDRRSTSWALAAEVQRARSAIEDAKPDSMGACLTCWMELRLVPAPLAGWTLG